MTERVRAQRAPQVKRAISALPKKDELLSNKDELFPSTGERLQLASRLQRPALMRGADVLRLQRLVGNQAVTSMLMQRYYEPNIAESPDKYRFSDNDGIAVKQEQAEGGQEVWATKDLMDSGNTTLEVPVRQSSSSKVALAAGRKTTVMT